MTDTTHEPSLTSWVDSANQGSGFPIQNLPFGIFRESAGNSETEGVAQVGVRIGDSVLDANACVREGLLSDSAAAHACTGSTLNALMVLDKSEIVSFRRELSELLQPDTPVGKRARKINSRILRSASDVTMLLPVEIGDYTDFYASVDHATNVGSMFRPDNPLLPNYKHIPIGYHGRASSIVASGTPVRRPNGQTKAPDKETPSFGPSAMLDYESELGFFVRGGNSLGESIPIDEARESIFGFCLVNDWSARDIQAWEYQPLGPFLAKNFATTVSHWVITAEAVEPYLVRAPERPEGDPKPLPYLRSGREKASGAINAFLEVFLSTETMRRKGVAPERLSRAPFASMYWTVGQMLAHHTSNGCNLRPGDLLASGTVSGKTPESRGCLLELTWRGVQPIVLPTGELRRFLEDGDEVIMKGSLEMEGRPTLEFGECSGVVV